MKPDRYDVETPKAPQKGILNSRTFWSLVVVATSVMGLSLAMGLLVGVAGPAQAAPNMPNGDLTTLNVTEGSTGPERIPQAQTDLSIMPGAAQPPLAPLKAPLLQDSPVLTVTKTAQNEGGDPLRPSERITYTITISNSGDITATGVVVSDSLPNNTSYVPDSITISPSSAGGVTDDFPPIAYDITVDPQSLVTVTFAVTVDKFLKKARTVITNTVSVTSTEVFTPATSMVTSTVVASPTLRIIKTGPIAASVGDVVTYTFAVSHDPTSIDEPFDRDSISIADTVAGPITSNPSGSGVGNGRLDVGEVWTYTASYTVLPTDPYTLVNQATVTGTTVPPTQIVVSATSNIHSLNLVYAPALTISKTGPITANVGDVVTYTLTVSHALTSDHSPVSNVVVTDDIASPVMYAGGDSESDNILAFGETWIYTASYTIQSDDPETLVNEATVTGKDSGGNNISPVSTTHSLDVIYVPVLTITKSGPASATAGSPITYTLTVTNSGRVTATNLVITDAIPAGATYISGGTKVGNVVSWTTSLSGNGAVTQTTFVVTASQTITNADYRVTADGAVPALGQEVVATAIGATGPVYLPIVFKPPPLTYLSVRNKNTGGNVFFEVLGTDVSCSVPNNTTRFCGSFPPGTYTVRATAHCGVGTKEITYPIGPWTTEVNCDG
jgi:uncharacterized repeat protein (TIGR01451 family)